MERGTGFCSAMERGTGFCSTVEHNPVPRSTPRAWEDTHPVLELSDYQMGYAGAVFVLPHDDVFQNLP